MKSIIPLVSGILIHIFAFSGYSQPSTLPIDASHSVISFSVGFAGGITNIEGRFNDYSGEIGYKKIGDITSLFTNVKISVASINTGDSQRDEDLQGAGFFNVEEFPEIIFNSKSVKKTGDQFTIIGDFTMVGITKEIEVPFEYSHQDPVVWVFGEPRIAVRGNITINRSEFSIPKRGWDSMVPTLGSMMLNENVEIRLVVQGVGQGLSDILMEKIENTGVKTAIDEYKRLAKENEGKETYGFGARTLVGLSMDLTRSEKHPEAISIAEFALETEPDNFLGFYALGNAHQGAGNKKKAIANLEKALELNPKFGRAQKQLEELKNQ